MNKKTSFGRSPKRRFKTNLFSLMGRTNIACPDSIFTITGGASAYRIFCRKRNENRYTLLSPFSHIKFFTFSQLLLYQRKALLSILCMYFSAQRRMISLFFIQTPPKFRYFPNIYLYYNKFIRFLYAHRLKPQPLSS